MEDDRYLVSMEPLATSDAVVALILVDGRRYLLQLRDESPGIFFPGHWGTFGGALDRGETFLQGLRRELFEELELEFEEATYFTSFDIDYSFAGLCVYRRAYYVVDIKEEALAGLTLHEGAAMRAFTFEEFQTLDKVTPYDGFAVWLHANRERIFSGQDGDNGAGGRRDPDPLSQQGRRHEEHTRRESKETDEACRESRDGEQS